MRRGLRSKSCFVTELCLITFCSILGYFRTWRELCSVRHRIEYKFSYAFITCACLVFHWFMMVIPSTRTRVECNITIHLDLNVLVSTSNCTTSQIMICFPVGCHPPACGGTSPAGSVSASSDGMRFASASINASL